MASCTDLSGADVSSQSEVGAEGAALYSILLGLCENNVSFFENDQSEPGQKLHQSSLQMQECLKVLSPKVEELRTIAPQFDFDENTPYNGYRSFVSTMDMCITYSLKLTRQVSTNRSSYFFRKAHYVKELEICAQMMDSLRSIAELNLKLVTWSQPGKLFALDKSMSFEEIYVKITEINLHCFYGRCIGFQFKESLQQVIKTLAIMLASFSEVYFCSEGSMLARATNSVWHSSKYLVDPELRAKRIVQCTIWASVEFCKAFWFLGEIELLNKVPNLVYSSVAVNRLIKLEPVPLQIISMTGSTIDIPVPCTSVGIQPLNVRLIAKLVYEGMEEDCVGSPTKTAPVPRSTELVFHCHGGGFVAQSSRSHEMYLREWAILLNCPMVSVDYALAPEAPFPRALEDVLYAYCWTLNNAAQLGSTADKIIFAGDSAGANLCLSLAFKCIELGVRPPDGIFLAYAPVLISFLPSPSRLLSLLDPILPIGFLSACLRAYADPQSKSEMSKYEHRLKRTSSVKITDSNVPTVSSPIEKPETVIMDVSPVENKFPPNLLTKSKSCESDCDSKPVLAQRTVKSSFGIRSMEAVPDSDFQREEQVVSKVGSDCPIVKKPSPLVETIVAPSSCLSLTSSSSLLINTIQQVTSGQEGRYRKSDASSLCPTVEIPVESKSSIEDFTGKAGLVFENSQCLDKVQNEQSTSKDTLCPESDLKGTAQDLLRQEENQNIQPPNFQNPNKELNLQPLSTDIALCSNVEQNLPFQSTDNSQYPGEDKSLMKTHCSKDQNVQSPSTQNCLRAEENTTKQSIDTSQAQCAEDVALKNYCVEQSPTTDNARSPKRALSQHTSSTDEATKLSENHKCKEDSKTEIDDESNSKLRPEFSRAVESVTTAITNVFINFTKSNNQPAKVDQGVEALDEEEISIPLEYFTVKPPADYYLSPILAPDNLLKSLPAIKLLTTEMDPFLDDCVSFAKKMKAMDHDVSLDVLPGLPHGFLTFALINKEANEGSELCCRRIREMLDMPAEEGTEAASVKADPCATAPHNEKLT
ncbi:uncharacterized protein Hsl isoform X2 [Bemisia tabaci]|uniref:uncharacterized protein Hsl isoform X2 n=1 Tax=Bemisia tabaci TaxID=7038 RepID=UPI003B28A2FD